VDCLLAVKSHVVGDVWCCVAVYGCDALVQEGLVDALTTNTVAGAICRVCCCRFRKLPEDQQEQLLRELKQQEQQ